MEHRHLWRNISWARRTHQTWMTITTKSCSTRARVASRSMLGTSRRHSSSSSLSRRYSKWMVMRQVQPSLDCNKVIFCRESLNLLSCPSAVRKFYCNPCSEHNSSFNPCSVITPFRSMSPIGYHHSPLPLPIPAPIASPRAQDISHSPATTPDVYPVRESSLRPALISCLPRPP